MKDFPLDLCIDKDPAKGTYLVNMTAGAWKERADFAYNLQSARLARVAQSIENNDCKLEELRDIGTNLWSGLMAGKVGELFETVRKLEPGGVRFQFRLELPPELEPLPWESLYYERNFGFVSSQHVILRLPTDVIDAPSLPPEVARPLRILAVVPMGSGLGTDRELHNLRVAVSGVDDAVLLEDLGGRVTPDLLEQRLTTRRWDVVHFIGHGELDEGGRTKIRLTSDRGDDLWMDGEVFSELFRGSGVRLAVLNCCEAARPMPGQSLSGLGPLLLRAGVPAVVAMRYEIRDDIAILFSEKFYQGLLAGPAPGRVDLAVVHARRAIYRNQHEHSPARAFITPLLYLAPGCERLFAIPSPPVPDVRDVAPQPGPEPALPQLPLPAELLDALLNGRCVPVIGPGTLNPGALRAPPPFPGPRDLASTLADKFNYPRRERDLKLCEAAGGWMDLLLLQWVCQHYLATRKQEFFRLIQTIQNIYAKAKPPSILSLIAEWEVPGLFYLYFDGLLAQAFDDLRKTVRVVNVVDEPLTPGGDLPLLVHVRGTHKFEDSLVLTEQDHDELWERIGRMSQGVTDLVRGHSGRSLLFLGASPRDPLLKRLTAKLLDQVSNKKRGPMFFVCPQDEQGDPYWDAFAMNWIEGGMEDVVSALTEAVRKGRS